MIVRRRSAPSSRPRGRSALVESALPEIAEIAPIALGLVAALALALGLAGCRRDPAPLLRYDDLVAGPGLTSTLPEGEPSQLVCADQTYFSRPVRPGEELSAPVEFGEAPRLVVSGCAPAPAGEVGADGAGGPPAAGIVEIAAEALDGRAVRERIPAGDGGGWWRREIDLADLARAAGRVRVTAELPDGGRLLLRDLVLVHRLPPPPPTRARRRPPQVLLISIDTLRADYVGALGGAVATPTLDALAADGEVFTPHYALSSWTKPSHAGLLTGEQEAVHGAGGPDNPIRAGVVTLAERFRRAGFLTAGLVHDCAWLGSKFGFARGFDSYRAVKWGTGPLAREAVDWMAAHRDRPFFFFLHTFDVHSDFDKLPYEGPGVTRDTVAERFGVAGYGCRWGRCASDLLLQIDQGKIRPLPGEAEILRFLYGRGVEGVDAELAQLFAGLREVGLYDGLTIALTADHGESLLEHGRATHGNWWRQVIEVPLIVKWAGGERAGGGRRGPSSAVDVAPTLLAAAGVDAGELPGTDLRTRPADRPVLVDGPGWQAIVVGSLKGVVGVRELGPQLYDLAADPGEVVNLAAERTADAELLAGRLAELRRQGERRAAKLASRPVAGGDRVTLTEAERERLRALGYLGGSP